MGSLKLGQDTPAHLGQLHLAFWNPNLHKASLVGPTALHALPGQARNVLKKGTVVETLVELAGDGEEGNFRSSLLGQEQLRGAEDLRGLLSCPPLAWWRRRFYFSLWWLIARIQERKTC